VAASTTSRPTSAEPQQHAPGPARDRWSGSGAARIYVVAWCPRAIPSAVGERRHGAVERTSCSTKPQAACEPGLDAVVGVNHCSGNVLAAADGHAQRVGDQGGGLRRVGRPAHHPRSPWFPAQRQRLASPRWSAWLGGALGVVPEAPAALRARLMALDVFLVGQRAGRGAALDLEWPGASTASAPGHVPRTARVLAQLGRPVARAGGTRCRPAIVRAVASRAIALTPYDDLGLCSLAKVQCANPHTVPPTSRGGTPIGSERHGLPSHPGMSAVPAAQRKPASLAE
jgi:hypothetical protein